MIYQNISHYQPIPISVHSVVGQFKFNTKSTDLNKRIYAIVNNMPSRYVTYSEATPDPNSNAELKSRWDTILSLAGAWKNDEDALTLEKLDEIREAMWGNFLDETNDSDSSQSHP